MKIKWKPLLAVGIIVIGYGAWKLRPDVPPIKGAEQLISLSGAHPFYIWLKDNEVMTYKDPDKGDLNFVRQNVDTKVTTPMPEVTALFIKHNGKIDTVLDSINNDRILWMNNNKTATSCKYDGSDEQTVDIGNAIQLFWSNNKFEWVAMYEANHLYNNVILYDVTDITHPKSRALVPPVDSAENLSNRKSLTMGEDQHILVNLWQGAPGKLSPTIVQALGMGATPSMATHLNFFPPRHHETGNIYFAPMSGLFLGHLGLANDFGDVEVDTLYRLAAGTLGRHNAEPAVDDHTRVGLIHRRNLGTAW